MEIGYAGKKKLNILMPINSVFVFIKFWEDIWAM